MEALVGDSALLSVRRLGHGLGRHQSGAPRVIAACGWFTRYRMLLGGDVILRVVCDACSLSFVLVDVSLIVDDYC